MKQLSIEEHVEKYWDVIDNHSLSNALMISSKRHKETKELLYILRNDRGTYGMHVVNELLEEIEARYEYEQAWRMRIKNRLKEANY
jgi:hypothetical protein